MSHAICTCRKGSALEKNYTGWKIFVSQRLELQERANNSIHFPLDLFDLVCVRHFFLQPIYGAMTNPVVLAVFVKWQKKRGKNGKTWVYLIAESPFSFFFIAELDLSWAGIFQMHVVLELFSIHFIKCNGRSHFSLQLHQFLFKSSIWFVNQWWVWLLANT